MVQLAQIHRFGDWFADVFALDMALDAPTTKGRCAYADLAKKGFSSKSWVSLPQFAVDALEWIFRVQFHALLAMGRGICRSSHDAGGG